jgi:hypothetical protein
MGLFGTLKKLSDSVNKVADDFGKSTVEDYGPPVYTLYTALQLGNLNRRIDVTDEQDNVKYYTKHRHVSAQAGADRGRDSHSARKDAGSPQRKRRLKTILITKYKRREKWIQKLSFCGSDLL